MHRIAVLLLALTLAAPAAAAAAEIYRWVDGRGQVHYSDLPPAGVRQAQRIAAPPGQGAPQPARPPVVLFTSECGATCAQAADYLRQRGVPFTLKSVDRDPVLAAELRQRTGAFEVPVLFVGESMQRGYAPSVWDKMLEMSGYPALDRPAPPAAAAAE